MNTSTSTRALAEGQFFEKVTGILDAGAVSVMMSLGHRLGLFDVMANMTADTSSQIAKRARLCERYVREWLAVMVVAGIVSYDPASKAYRLPVEHAACLIRTAPLGNLAVNAQFVTLSALVLDRIEQCFKTGDGLEYHNYPCFHQIMSEDSGQTVVANIDEILSTLVPDVLERLNSGITVLDAGCGAGLALSAMASRFPNSRFVGYDLCPDAIDLASATATQRSLSNIEFHPQDLSAWHEEAVFDLVTSFDAVHDCKDPAELLAAIHRALRPGGVHLMQDIGGSAHLENNIAFPFAALLYTISTVHCTPVSLAQGGVGAGTMWGWETAEQLLADAGFSTTTRSVMPGDPMNVWFVSRVSDRTDEPVRRVGPA